MNKRTIRLCAMGAALLILSAAAHALDPDTIWTKTYGGDDSDQGYYVCETQDGGFGVAGNTRSYGAGNNDMWLLRTDADGETLWTRTYGGAGDDFACAVLSTEDGGFALTGETDSYGSGGDDVYLVKVDSNGTLEWSETYGGWNSEGALSMNSTADGGYILVGETNTHGAGCIDAYLIRTDSAGDSLWAHAYGGPWDDCGEGVVETPDGGFLMVGGTKSFGAGGTDIWLIRTDSLGIQIWTGVYGGPAYDEAVSVQMTQDGGFIVLGYTSSYSAGDLDVFLMKVESDGDTSWMKTYESPGEQNGYSVAVAPDGGYVVSGWTEAGAGGMADILVMKTDSAGTLLWDKTYGGPLVEEGSCIKVVSGGGYVIAGQTDSFGPGSTNVYLLRMATCGDADGSEGTTPADGYTVLNYLGSGPMPVSCWSANAAGGDGITPADGYQILNYLGAGPDPQCGPCEF
jgi:hypothetical protein